MSGLLTPDIRRKSDRHSRNFEIFKVSRVGKVAGSKVLEGEIKNDLMQE